MRCWTVSLATLVLATGVTRAHFPWIVPDASGPSARVVFSDSLQPDRPEFLDRIAQTELFVRGPEGQRTPVRWTKGADAFEFTVAGKGPQVVGGVCRYGVFSRGDAEPFLLMYYPKALVNGGLGGDGPSPLAEPCDRLPLEIVRAGTGFRVLWQGKPLPNAEVVIVPPGQEKSVERKTDAEGRFAIEPFKPGLYGIRARHSENQAGTQDGKKYQGVRHYATLAFHHAAAGQAAKPTADADPAATKLLADARAARAQWLQFPGFKADLEINVDGQVTRGKVEVTPAGKVTIQTPNPEASQWALRMLRSIVSHRLDNSAALDTPCAFTDDCTTHPLGRALRVLNDELHSSYRVRDRQILVVNRQMQDARFTITVLENRRNEEQLYLPAHYVVNTWDVATGALKSSESHHQTWERVSRFDLPATARVVTATAGKLEARGLTLSNHKLGEPGVKQP